MGVLLCMCVCVLWVCTLCMCVDVYEGLFMFGILFNYDGFL